MIEIVTPQQRIILALDRMSESEALTLIAKLPDLVWVKVGLELFTYLGPEILSKLKGLGKKVFLDLKFHDIPSTMSSACFRAAQTGAELITVHACAGRKGLEESNQAAIIGAKEIGFPPPTLLAVTVLTSWQESSFCKELNIDQSIEKRVNFLTNLAFNAGIGGCVCSPLEVENLRKDFPEPFKLITPGIRSFGVNVDDQKRTLSPMEAVKLGASQLVVGREITKAEKPADVFARICDQLAGF